MKKGLIALLIVVVIVVAFAGTLISKYNTLVQLNENVSMQMSEIDNQLQRRNDLIPNLVETVKGFASQEREIFENIANARAAMMSAGTVAEKSEANGELSGALSRLLAISESYPDLKSNENFIQLADELAGTENRIAFARQDYNTVAREFNGVAKQFPMNLFAGMFGFDTAEYFEAAEGADAVPEVDFGN
ncbi:LemA family protein [Fusibacter tunisiensis]|uniref:LemA protein n=1 Tax=Fusibacter tunisiensis TaxID=1008308 RepID=A0ABS2MQS6_9FIRM|nr:LemA family protein [Fusibacter tunisiensis]MBM7561721.1 LemA protein [Fusibacter tunisiensis]